MAPEQPFIPDENLASADYAAVAALRELPEALIFVFDRNLRFIVTAPGRITPLKTSQMLR